jgi:DnaJ-class molecular chaperone
MAERKNDTVERMKPGDEAAAGTPGTGEALCPDCAGSGRLEARPCPNCEGTGKVIAGVAGG